MFLYHIKYFTIISFVSLKTPIFIDESLTTLQLSKGFKSITAGLVIHGSLLNDTHPVAEDSQELKT